MSCFSLGGTPTWPRYRSSDALILKIRGSVQMPVPRLPAILEMRLCRSTVRRLLSMTQIVLLFSITGDVLDGLGGLYLAYELLGGKHGPLRLLSRLLTYSAVLGLGYGAAFGLWFGLTGALVSAPTIEYLLTRRARNIAPSNIEWVSAAMLHGLSFGIAGWLTVGRAFGITFGTLCVLAMHITYDIGFGANLYRVYRKPRVDREIALAGTVRGILIGIAGVVSGAITRRPNAFLHGLVIGVVVGASHTALIILSPLVEWWVDNLPERALGSYGAFLVLIGSALQTVQYIMPLCSS